MYHNTTKKKMNKYTRNIISADISFNYKKT